MSNDICQIYSKPFGQNSFVTTKGYTETNLAVSIVLIQKRHSQNLSLKILNEKVIGSMWHVYVTANEENVNEI